MSTLNHKLIPAYQAARDYGISYQPLLAICKEHVGFAVVLGKRYHVPAEHMELLISCRLTPAEIAKRARGELAA